MYSSGVSKKNKKTAPKKPKAPKPKSAAKNEPTPKKKAVSNTESSDDDDNFEALPPKREVTGRRASATKVQKISFAFLSIETHFPSLSFNMICRK